MSPLSVLVDSNTIIYAAKKPGGAIARWMARLKPFVTDVSYYECLQRWSLIHTPDKALERAFLEAFFIQAQEESRYIETHWWEPENDYAARALELQFYGVKERDAYIAAAAERQDCLLVTADNRNDFAPRLLRLNELGKGAFKVWTYPFSPAGAHEQLFADWI